MACEESESTERGSALNRTKRFVGVVLGVALFLVVMEGSALAQGTDSVELHLKPLNDSGVSGTATLTSVEGGVQVKLEMQGFTQAGVSHINHFHGGGTCADVQAGKMAPVTIPLNPIVAQEDGTGSATTTLKDVTMDELFGGGQDNFILVHAKTKEGQGVPPGISCVDLPHRSGNAGFEALPASGGIPPGTLLAIALALILAGTAALLVVLRRTA